MTNPQRRLPEPVQSSRPANAPDSTLVTIPQAGAQPSVSAPSRPMPTSPDRLGEILRRRREERGDDLQYIADSLYIRRVYLEALEQSRYDALPADAYVIGFLRSYAAHLQLDSRDVINLYRAEMAGRRKKPALAMPTPVSEGRTPSAIIMVAAAIAALLIYALWYGLASSDRASVSKPPVLPPVATAQPSSSDTAPANLVKPAVTPVAPVVVAPAAATPVAPPAPVAKSALDTTASVASEKPQPQKSTPDKTQAAEQAPTVLIPPAGMAIRAEQSSWVLIMNRDGDTIYDHVMKPGEVYTVPDLDNLTLTTGNAPGIVVSEDGVDLPRFTRAKTTRVLRNVPLDSAHLRAKAAGTANSTEE